MKKYLLLVLIIQIIIACNSNSTNYHNELITKDPNPMKNMTELRNMVGKRLNDLWSWMRNEGKTEDNFIGRCFGVAKKIKQILPFLIFKMGVIMTTLAFLTIFSLKSLGLLVLLVVMNAVAFFSKLSFFKHEESHHSVPPQSVHFHIHQNKDGHYNLHHSGSGSDYYDHGWTDRNSLIDHNSQNDEISQRLKLLGLNNYPTR